MARFIGTETGDCLQVFSVSSTTRWLSSILLWKKSSLWAHKPALSLSPEEGQDPEMQSFSEPHFPFCTSATKVVLGLASEPAQLPGPQGCYGERAVKDPVNLGPLLRFDYMISGLVKSCLSFRLTSLFPGSREV